MAEGGGLPSGLPSIKIAGNKRPLLKDLHDHVLLEVADKWRDLGVQLLAPDHQGVLKVIAADHPRDVVSCCKCVLEKWLDTTTDATWDQLITALRSPSIQLDYLASQLEQMLITKCESALLSRGCANVCKLTSIDDIEVEFAKVTVKIKQALIRNNVDVTSLIEQLCAISAVGNKNVPLFDKDVFEKINSINEFWKELRMFWNIFDYDLLRFIIMVSECEEAQVIFDEFLSRIDPSAIEDVDLVLHCRVEHREGLLKPVLRIKINAEKCTVNIQRRAKEMVSEKFNLKEYTLCFKGIKKGCIELLYYISQGVMSHFLQYTITKDILEGLMSCHIISLHVNDHKLKVPFEITDIVETWSIDSQQEMTVPGLTSKPRGVAIIIANSYKETDIAVHRVVPGQRHLRYLPSSVKDADKLKRAFEYLKFLTIVKYNMTQSELLSFLGSLVHNPHMQICSRFVFAFYGHGESSIVYCEDRNAVQVSDILNVISNHDPLKNIPRMFFFDISQGSTEKWQPEIFNTDNVIVAFSTSSGSHRFLDGRGGSMWTDILTKKLVTSPQDIRSVIVETNEELVATSSQFAGFDLQQKKLTAANTHFAGFSLQQPQLFGKLNTTVCLLSESGQQPDYSDAVSAAVGLSTWASWLGDKDPFLIHRQRRDAGELLLAATTLLAANKLEYDDLKQVTRSSRGNFTKKAKSQLNELFQEYGITDAKYDSTDNVTDGNVHNFTATLTYNIHGRKYRYESRGVFGRKQDAEEDTAQQALCEIEQQQRQFVSRGPTVTTNHYKQLLKERYCDKQQLSSPQYSTTESASGGFVSTVNVPQYKPVRGPVGNSKKEAEQLAAMEALRQLKII